MTRAAVILAAGMGAVVMTCDVAEAPGTPRHDPLRLAAAFRDLFTDLT